MLQKQLRVGLPRFSDGPLTDPYLIPGTEVLRNKFDVEDAKQLSAMEEAAASIRAVELNGMPIRGPYDLAHLQRIHKHLFSDVYEWAGELRTIDFSKGDTVFCRCRFIASQATDIFRFLATSVLPVDPGETASFLAVALGNINALHPFREGNGRAQRAFLFQFARERGWFIDWRAMGQADNTRACISAMSGRYDDLTAVIRNLISPHMA